MCDCIQKMQEKVKAALSERGVKYLAEPEMQGKVLPMLDLNIYSAMGTAITWTEEVTARNGTKKPKKQKMNIVFPRCPFCGEKTDYQKAVEAKEGK
ncbi:hypothetical protein CRG49_008710 [Neisseria sp. N95_16]|uniref:Uncharacterized protein n=1 Tax=Neisseria brasiliensis TaxID=2666100 RepID=A0A5Q3RUW7_9NEIS|nr:MULTISPECIES: hypothetical protein [Neisseria]MRN37221.1 hypothetical protein [Neisseria brasiliensis]PJO09228.1 hypothetical protein CRG49_008710 [Neisseria sp. N95_16]PJO77118.1 hypothetical protein CWC45_12140 [Neisseria sp. N177_16]QGL24232.1 hypothetical protein GJV52_00880 [Neisseria brasiliensis]